MKNFKTKKLIACIMAIAMIMTSVIAGQMSVLAGDVTYTFDESTGALVVTGTGAMDDYDENTLTDIPWYSVRSSINSITVSEGITHIGNYAFCREVNVADVSLPDTLTSIGDAAFAGDSALKSLTIPDSVTEVGSYAFGYAYDMSLTDDFVATCGKNSAAQTYCIKSYVPFDVPFDASGDDRAVILGSNWQAMWSIVPASTGTVDFWSTGGADTFGLIYDSSDYIYNAKYSEMAKSAIKTHDDISGSDCNFHITYTLEAGKRYYLAAKYMSASKTAGQFDVHMTFSCDEHAYDLVSNTATCTQGGTATYVCSVCGDTMTEESSPLGHDYSSTTVDPTCTTKGLITYTCTRCTATYTEDIDVIEHTPGEAAKENNVDPTCTEAGSYDMVTRCTVCTNIISSNHVDVNPLGHSYTTTTVDPTCQEAGKTIYTCTRGDSSYEEPIDMLEHTPGKATKENEVDPTCTDAGSYDMVTRCIECETVLSTETIEVDPIDHIAGEPTSTVVDPTCTEPGATIITTRCTMCEEVLDQELTELKDALGHDYTSVTVDPTCTAKGKTTYTCSRCTDSYEEDIEMLPHTLGEATRENEKDPTCTKAGSYDMVTRCTVCTNVVDKTTTPIDALGHDYEIFGFADGIVGTACNRCDHYKGYVFMDYLNTEATGTEILDVVEDGFINAKDYAKLRKEIPAITAVCDIDLTAGTISKDNATLEDGVLTLTPDGKFSTFNLTGTVSDVKIVINAKNDVDINLVNANLTVDSANAITINNTATNGTIPVVTFYAKDGTENSITTTTTGNAISNYTDAIGACKLEFKGHGKITFNTASTSINSGAKVEIKNITMDITSGNRGFDTKYTTPDGLEDYASIDVEGNATITINSVDDGIRCQNFETKALAEGEVDSIINITAGGDGIQMEGKKSAFNSGIVTITATGYAFNCKAANFKINAGATVNATGGKGYSK